jgi:glycosyltransferase A (GT-A) superfamily protein (DUF2064 family)
MTTVAMLAAPPQSAAVLPGLWQEGPLDREEAATLYTAMTRDVCRAVAASGADLLVNYRQTEAVEGSDDAEADLREVLEGAIPQETRFETQVGDSFAGRVGNTVTHLLESEEVQSAGVATPAAALLARKHVDQAAMKLRSKQVVLAPALDGRVAYAAFAAPIDFEDAFATPALETLVDRGHDADLDVDFVEPIPTMDTPAALRTALPVLRARAQSDLIVPAETASVVEEFGLQVVEDDGPTLSRA